MSPEKLYVATTLVMEDVRVVNDCGEPILVPLALFEVLDDHIPEDWKREVDDAEGWRWWGPPECAARGFFERWHDGHARERQVFAEVYEQLWCRYEQQLQGQPLTLKR